MPAAEVPPTGSSGTTLPILLAGAGRVLVALGLLTLAFAAFQLWGTGLVAGQAQDRLAADFEMLMTEADGRVSPAAPDAIVDRLSMTAPQARSTGLDSPDRHGEVSVGRRLADPHVAEGEAIATLVIPAIGLDKTVVQGTDRDALATGPGRYTETPLPGRSGNAGIAGHRTTHGAPFLDIDLLKPGDEIVVETLDGTFTYLVEAQDDGAGGQVGHLIVDPSEVSVLADKGDNRLTLTACHPKFSARQRIIVTATLVGAPFEPTPSAKVGVSTAPATGPVMLDQPSFAARGVANDTPTIAQVAEGSTADELGSQLDATRDSAAGIAGPAIGGLDQPAGPSLGWQSDHLGALLRWVATTAAMTTAAWLVGRLWRRFPAYAMAVPPVTLSLFNLFASLERFLPAL